MRVFFNFPTLTESIKFLVPILRHTFEEDSRGAWAATRDMAIYGHVTQSRPEANVPSSSFLAQLGLLFAWHLDSRAPLSLNCVLADPLFFFRIDITEINYNNARQLCRPMAMKFFLSPRQIYERIGAREFQTATTLVTSRRMLERGWRHIPQC